MRIIKVKELDFMGFEGNTKYFKSLNKAKKYFKSLVRLNKKNLVEDEECSYFKKAINYSDKPKYIDKKNRYRRVDIEIWNKCETEYGTEYYTQPLTVVLEEINIEG